MCFYFDFARRVVDVTVYMIDFVLVYTVWRCYDAMFLLSSHFGLDVLSAALRNSYCLPLD